MDWKDTLEEILAERRRQLGEPPSDDDFVALRAGDLSEDERRRLLEHAAVDPAVARELFDVLRFPHPSGDDSPEQEVDGVGERWQALRERLVAEGDLPAAEVARVPARWRVTWLPLAAMFVLGVAVTWIADRWRQADVAVDPRINLAIVELLPVDDEAGGVRGAEVVTIDAGTGGLVLTLAVPGRAPTPEQGPYTLELTRSDGTTTTLDGLAPGVGGVFVLDLPREEWAADVHELRLKDRDGQSVARFQLEVVLRR